MRNSEYVKDRKVYMDSHRGYYMSAYWIIKKVKNTWILKGARG